MSYVQETTNIREDNENPNYNLTSFVFFKNTPLTDYNNTIHFKSNKERDAYFLDDGHFYAIKFEKQPFNFIRDRLKIRVAINWRDAMGINYCTFLSDFEDRRYYAFVNEIEYLNDNTILFSLVIDTVMTFLQGNELEKFTNMEIERQHLSRDTYERMLPELRNNDDVIKASNKHYIANKHEDFGTNYVVFQSSADLRKEFGTKKDPNLESSQGTIYDKITSPVDLYIIDYDKFNAFMDKMSKYPWITQNFQKIQLIPKRFFDGASLEKIETKEDLGEIFTLKSGQFSKRWTLDSLETDFDELRGFVASQDNDALKHLVRNEYLTIELYSWDGDSLLLDAGHLPQDTGLKLNTRSIIGYHNEVRVYPVHYRSGENEKPVRRVDDDKIIVDMGSFLNKALTFDRFAEVPILIDNGTLQYSQRANKRQLQEDRLPTNRIKGALDSSADPKDRFFDAYNTLGNLNPLNLFGKFNEEHEKYQDMQAEDKDLALQPPEVTSSEMGNAFQIANDINGLSLKVGAPSPDELTTIIRYYLMFGYGVDEKAGSLDPVDSMTVCNYVKMTGMFNIPDVDPSIVEQMSSILETGVRLWHNDNSDDPTAQDPLKNTFRE